MPVSVGQALKDLSEKLDFYEKPLYEQSKALRGKWSQYSKSRRGGLIPQSHRSQLSFLEGSTRPYRVKSGSPKFRMSKLRSPSGDKTELDMTQEYKKLFKAEDSPQTYQTRRANSDYLVHNGQRNYSPIKDKFVQNLTSMNFLRVPTAMNTNPSFQKKQAGFSTPNQIASEDTQISSIVSPFNLKKDQSPLTRTTNIIGSLFDKNAIYKVRSFPPFHQPIHFITT